MENLYPKHGLCEIDRAGSGKLRNKNVDESWEIIENLALYDHEGWNDTKNSSSRSRPFLRLKASQKHLTEDFLSSKTRLTSYKRDRDQPLGAQHTSLMLMPMQSIPTLACPSPQPQALGTTFEARVRDYMAAHTKRMERFENAIFKQREEINDRMTKIGEEEGSDKTDETLNNTVKPTITETKILVKEAKRSDETKIKLVKRVEKKEVEELLSSRPVEYYLKHRINEKLIEGLVYNNRFNDSLSRARVGKVKGKTYNVLTRGPVYEAILKKKITKKEDIGGNFKIPCSIEGLKHVNALVDQGSDVNVMPYSTYTKLTDERPAETNIRLSLASHSYIYPLGIAEDLFVEVAEHVYPVDFVILDIKENEKRPFILGTPFLTTIKATIRFDKGTITLRLRKSKVSFHRIPDPPCMTDKGVKNDIEPIAPTMTVNRLVLEWEEKIKLHLEREMKFNQ
ncbi:MAK10-like protein [Tanacetum coccineum]|uniref:MAK10-like protein n=1 Tax=Tanacetum coccineum TaxID=301880 RepID=A0ABQ4WYN0_9ASTR